MPVVGFLNAGSPEAYASYVTSFRRGLREAGSVEGENVAIEFHGHRANMTDCRRWPPNSFAGP
jgi:hypothetical protein